MNPEDLKNCALFTIWLGANDASLAEQKVELPEYRNNLSQMITYLSSDLGLSSERIVLINPPPIDETKEDPDKPKIRTLENTRLYAKACIEVAKANGVECVDMFNALLNQEDWQSYLIDGLHFCRKGSNFVTERLIPVVESRLSPCAMIFPHWVEALKLDLRKPIPW
uniref:Isoamyl acetate-hydrolyzing esterase 1 homolog n=2 Tax=Schistocephalus solidus TaxID=70667 RepID=A0A0X3Q151_SCHSO